MALGDLYELRWRTEQAAVVMNNSVLYKQTESNIGTFLSPVLALIEAIQEGGNNVLAYWRQVGTDTAFITCAIAEKVWDGSATGPEQAILFDQGFTAIAEEPLAPSQCLTLQLLTNSDSADAYSWRNLYLGGLDESILDGYGLADVVSDLLWSNGVWLLRPETGQPGIQPFTAVLSIDPKIALEPSRTVTRINPPHYLTRKNSRRLSLCV